MTEAVIEADGLTRRLAGEVTVTLVEDATLMVHQGEFVAITGASGSGKSSLLYLLGLLTGRPAVESGYEGMRPQPWRKTGSLACVWPKSGSSSNPTFYCRNSLLWKT